MPLTLPARAARRTVLQKVRGRAHAALPQFMDTGFQVLFHSPPGVLFTFPSQYYALSVTKGISPYGVVPAPSARVSRVPAYSGTRPAAPPSAYGAFTLSGRLSQSRSAWLDSPFRGPEPRGACAAVWAPPVSLAATPGIDLSFFSSGYLDVSVRRVPLHALWIHAWMHGVRPVRVSPFRHLRITGYVPLPAAFRSLSRLSSALSAKASALCPFCLTSSLYSVTTSFWIMHLPMLPFVSLLFSVVIDI